MRAVDIIRKKRDAGELSREEIEFIVAGATRETIPDYQLAAWLMAVVWRGMTRAELAALTEAMLHSGVVLDFSGLAGPKVDKHSTGGVGDKTSLVIAPVVAAAGLYVPMISGRGLGHTGGTLDKLESISGFNVNLLLEEFRRVLEATHCGLIGQTPEIAPADKKLYALRDVTATVESPYLICASIMSKKMAEGIDALVLDVKTGGGAFMKKQADAEYLAELMVETGTRMGKKVVALITDMDQPLGRKIGNALEVEECLETLHGKGPEDLLELSIELSAWMFVLGARAKSIVEGRALAAEMIASGRARDTLREIIRIQGGDARVVDDPARLPRARHIARVKSPRAGFVTAIHSEQVGVAGMLLGGGREKKEDRIDPAVGLVLAKKVGDAVEAGEDLCAVHYNEEGRLAPAVTLLEKSFEIGDAAPPAAPLVRKIIGAE
ncbi:MAG TPA: thymidine phosphorylase [Candidatus Sulfotelmatobacter sp.]|nr:thymidine phosphorylase [Candidatus Sulfotelmatobacter sp.]